MSIFVAAVLALGANDEYDLDLAAALARRGWVELAEEVCGRIDKNQAGLPIVLAEVSFAKARREADVRRAAKELDLAVERLTRAGRAPTLEERGMTGWLHVQKSKILTQAAEDDAALRPEAAKSWEATEAYYRASTAELEKLPSNRAVEEAMLDARLEIPKAMAAQARVPAIDEARRTKLLQESARLFSEIMWGPRQPVLLEASLEEARCRADLKDYGRAERGFKSLPGLALDIRKAGYPMGDYMKAQLHAGVLSLAEMLTPAGKPKDAIALCDVFLQENPRLVRSPIGSAIMLAKAEALKAAGDDLAAIDLAVKVAGQDGGIVGRKASGKIGEWTRGKAAPPERVMAVADRLIDRGEHREALIQIRRCIEQCATPADLAKHEPAALFKRGDCFRALKQELEASVTWQELFRKYPAHPLASKAAIEAVRSLSLAGEPSEVLEKLLDEIDKRKLAGEGSLLKYLRAGILENRKRYKDAAALYLQVDESFEAFDDAIVSAGHCLRLDSQPAAAEAALKRALARNLIPRLLFTAHHEVALILLQDRPKEALEHLATCTSLMPPENPNVARLLESEIQAHLSLKDLDAAADRLAKLLARFPDTVQTLRSCRRVAARLEPTQPAKAAQVYRAWLERSSTTATTLSDVQAVADGLYRIARTVNGMEENVVSVTDLKGKAVRDRAAWTDAVRAHELLIAMGGPAETRLVWCAGLAGDWTKAKTVAEKLVESHRLLKKDGTIDADVLRKSVWLAGIYFDYGHALYELGRAGQKFQFGNAITVFNNLAGVTASGTEPWWIAHYMAAKVRFERGEGDDIKQAGAALSILERSNPGFDGGKFGMKDRMVELRDQIRSLQR
jgi:tetratricopeptide (TPR) repeat protein